MSRRGFGAQPFAKGPFPFGFPESSGLPVTPALFNPVTNDRNLDTALSVSATQQRVQLALASFVKKSILRPEFGISMPEFIRSTIQSDMNESVERCLEQMIVDEEINIESVATEFEGSRIYLAVSYTDLTTGQEIKEKNEITRTR